MSKITDLISNIGTNPTFIAFNAHCWFAFAALVTWGDPVGFPVLLAVAAVKEFWFDANYETPKQNFLDNFTDFTGYLVGLGLGYIKITYLI